MAFDLQPGSDRADATNGKANGKKSDFSVSPEPIVAERGATVESEIDQLGLPRSYGSETLCLMPRDPHSLFAYWDIDWKKAFGEENPRQREVQLRIFNADGSEQISLEVEPLAGNCYVSVTVSDASYHGEIGYFDSTSTWNAVQRSGPVLVPPDIKGQGEPADFATVPFHLGFQRMIGALPDAQQENESLTAMLSKLRERAVSDENVGAITSQQRELASVVEEAAAKNPPPDPQAPAFVDLWADHELAKILGFGNSSLTSAFGGSSRS